MATGLMYTSKASLGSSVAEQLTLNQWVAGSNPARGTKDRVDAVLVNGTTVLYVSKRNGWKMSKVVEVTHLRELVVC